MAQNIPLVSVNDTQCTKEKKTEWCEYRLLMFYGDSCHTSCNYKMYDSCHHGMQHWKVTVNNAGDRML